MAIAAADLNRDGKTDLISVNYTANTVSVLLGNGNGGFSAAISYPVGTGPFAIVTGDFNNDGKPDIAVVNEGTNNVSILLGNGDGTAPGRRKLRHGERTGVAGSRRFRSGWEVGPGHCQFRRSIHCGAAWKRRWKFSSAERLWPLTRNTMLLVADFSQDGKPDIVFSGSDYLYVCLGNGDGSFASPVSTYTSSCTRAPLRSRTLTAMANRMSSCSTATASLRDDRQGGRNLPDMPVQYHLAKANALCRDPHRRQR